MYWNHEHYALLKRQSGQVLAESVVTMLLLVVLVCAIHMVGRLQYQWTKQWLATQSAASAATQGHGQLPAGARKQFGESDRWRSQVMREYSIGQASWVKVSTKSSYEIDGWRLVGFGQASSDDEVVNRINNAPRLWRLTATRSQIVANSLLPTLKAIDMPWRRRGNATEWLSGWRGSTPDRYLNSLPAIKR